MGFFGVVYYKWLDLFTMVYVVVIGQMSLVASVVLLILDGDEKYVNRANGFLSVSLALVGAWIIAILSIGAVGPFGEAWLDWLPLITIGLGILGLAIPKDPLFRFKRLSDSGFPSF